MRLIYAVFILILALMTSVQCQQTAEDWYNQGNMFFDSSKYNESIDAYSKAIELNQSYAEAWEHKGNALSELGKNEEASDAYKKAFELDPKITRGCLPCGQGRVEWYWHDKGNGFLFENNSEEALTAYNKAIEINPQFGPSWWNKGNILLGLDKYDDAIQAYNISIEMGESDPYHEGATKEQSIAKAIDDVRYAQGMDLKKLGRDSEAMIAFAKVVTMPAWMEFITFTRGQGFDGLLILYDNEDEETSCDGKLRIEVYEDGEYEEKLWSQSYDVKKSEFAEHKWGFGREANA